MTHRFTNSSSLATKVAEPSQPIMDSLRKLLRKFELTLTIKPFQPLFFIDLEKAFDTVNHCILLKKLDHYGINNIANRWLGSYLSNRMQNVSLNGVSSENEPITCGVPLKDPFWVPCYF